MQSTQTTTIKQTGFTLIELLIVVLIISILAGLVLTVINPQGLRMKSRDAQRKSDVKKIQTALELYFADNRKYPETASGSYERIGASGDAKTALEAGYLSKIPQDPLFTGTFSSCSDTDFDYSYISDGNEYALVAFMEMESSAEDSLCSTVSNGVFSCGSTSNLCYGVQNP